MVIQMAMNCNLHNLKFVRMVMLALFFMTACDSNSESAEPYEFTELAMQPNMVIEARNDNGSVSIEYLSPLMRRYKWSGYNEVRTLIPRKERWLGLLGAYNPATVYFWEFWKPSPRIVAQDSLVHFESRKEAKTWLKQGSAVMDWVYTDNGLVVGFAKSPSRNQVNIEVYQIYIDGKKPTKLEGSRPENIQIFGVTDI